MRKILIAAVLVVAGTSAASAQGYGYGAPYAYSPGIAVYAYAPAYAPAYYGYAPGGWYGSYDGSGNSYRQPSPSSTIRAVR